MAAPWYQWDGADLLLAVLIQLRASINSLDDTHGERLKVRLTAPPVDDKANSHLIRLLAKHFAVPRRQVLLLSGKGSRAKRVRLQRPRQLPAGIPPGNACRDDPGSNQPGFNGFHCDYEDVALSGIIYN